MLLPAAGFAAGSRLAFELPYLPVPLLAALALLALALRRPAATCLAFLSLGLLVATVRLGLPADPAAALIRESPVEAVVKVAGHWAGDDDGWSAPARVLRLRQGDRVATPPLDVIVHLPDGEAAPPAFGSTLRVRGYLSRSPGFANRIPVSPGPWRLRVKSRQLLTVEAPPGWIARLSGALRRRVEEAYRAAGPESAGEAQGKALARALVLGDAGELPVDWKRGLRVTGVYHLLSVSGVHVALVAGAVWLLGGFLPRRPRLVLMLAASALYLLLVGPLPALVRSAVMAGLAVLALLAERPPAAANALGWAVILLLAGPPRGGALPRLPAHGGRPRRGFCCSRRGSSRVGAAAVSRVGSRHPLPPASAPSSSPCPGRCRTSIFFSPLAPLLNLPAVPWTGLALAASLLWTLVALVSAPLAAWLLPALDHLAVPFSWPSRTPPGAWCTLPMAIPFWAASLLARLYRAGSSAAAQALGVAPSRRGLRGGRSVGRGGGSGNRAPRPPSSRCSTSARGTPSCCATATGRSSWMGEAGTVPIWAAGSSCRPCWARASIAWTPW